MDESIFELLAKFIRHKLNTGTNTFTDEEYRNMLSTPIKYKHDKSIEINEHHFIQIANERFYIDHDKVRKEFVIYPSKEGKDPRENDPLTRISEEFINDVERI